MEIKWFTVSNDWMDKHEYLYGRGQANGYIIIPKGHPWFGKDYMEIECDVHGGLTFGRYMNPDQIEHWSQFTDENLTDTYVYGFDTNHFGDNSVTWSLQHVIEETKRLAKQAEI